jgi:ATP-dependent DNA helicase RecG
MSKRGPDEVDVACYQWAKGRRKQLGLDDPRMERAAAQEFIGALRSTLGQRRDLHSGATTTRADIHCPEGFYSDKGLLVNLAFKTLTPFEQAVMEMQYVFKSKADEKAEVMGAFKRGEVHVLVATTVIEVGVDVPAATLMVIEHAERMGLAQLHQLRGRVGRGGGESACILLYQQPLSETARARLRVIYEHTDGFAIAREDLRLRGPGELLGSRQSGVPMLRFADPELDVELLEAARSAADTLLRDAPSAASRHVERWLGGREELLRV